MEVHEAKVVMPLSPRRQFQSIGVERSVRASGEDRGVVLLRRTDASSGRPLDDICWVAGRSFCLCVCMGVLVLMVRRNLSARPRSM